MQTEEIIQAASPKELFEGYLNLLKKHECDKYDDTNLVVISGVIERDFVLCYRKGKENFYGTEISVYRDSGILDTIHIVVSECMLKNTHQGGKYAEIFGVFNSSNVRKHLILRVLAYGIEFYDLRSRNRNEIYLSGNICKPPTYRTTPFGRTISDVMIAVHRKNGESDYIPCIAWSRNALTLSNAKVGQKVSIYGRIQSREYTKYVERNGAVEQRIAYEVSISTMNFL